MSLEELAQVDINSVSRRPQALSEAAAAIYVINRDDIRRSGATSLPEVLRLAPNLQIQRVNTGDYAISARGFNGFETANKVLVLIDGRSIYTTLFSGVLWDAQGVVLEDIERIEVISGPGGTLYGANAVNGVINIITRDAHDTASSAIAATGGTEESTLALRQGWNQGAWAGRVYAQGFERDGSYTLAGADGPDAFRGARIGFRADRDGANRLSVSGAIYEHSALNDADITGGNLTASLNRDLSGGGTVQLSGYYDLANRDSLGVFERVETMDLFAQHAMGPIGAHRLVWGGGYRLIDNSLVAPPGAVAFLAPPRRNISLTNLFVQDQIALSPSVELTLGLKAESNSFSGDELLPSARLAWRRANGDLLWGAMSRAVRAPSRIDRELTFPPVLVAGDFQSETVNAYEIGYRSAPLPNASFSVSVFYNDYDRLRTVGPTTSGATTISFRNDAEGKTYGLEAWGAFDVTPGWRLTAGLATLHKDFDVYPGAVDITSIASKGFDPTYQVLLGSQNDIGDHLTLDVRLRAVGELEGAGVDDYIAGDVRLGWRITPRAELALVGSNLFAGRVVEAADPARHMAFGPAYHLALKVGF